MKVYALYSYDELDECSSVVDIFRNKQDVYNLMKDNIPVEGRVDRWITDKKKCFDNKGFTAIRMTYFIREFELK